MSRAPQDSVGAEADTEHDRAAVSTTGPSLEDRGFAARYQTRSLLGAGGMGEVHLCRDARIGREVAMKRIHGAIEAGSGLRARFVREARVQGQLEHPAIVPVYDIGLSPEGTPYFTMKRIQGIAFDAVVERLRAGTETRTAHQLLAAFSTLCQAVEFAHAHGVVHRDLKPGNLMLGDFGETYILDWGLAKVGAEGGEDPALTIEASSDASVETMKGGVLGTLGYMAPEQLRGDDVDGRTDVYALGAVLFELLALEPLHARGSAAALAGSTLRGADARPSARAPHREIAPELDAICVRATALEPSERCSARDLSNALERYLDGDRDLVRRREMSVLHAERAEQALGGGDDLESRRQAMHELGRALALDPQSPSALRTLTRVLLSPPRDLPPEAAAAITSGQDDAVRVSARAGGLARLSMLLIAPVVVWMGIRDAGPVAAMAGAMLLAALLSFANARAARPRSWVRDALLLASMASTTLFSFLFGPFILVPTVATITAVAFSLGAFTGGERTKIVVLCCLSVIVPVILERAGVWPAFYDFSAAGMRVLPQAVEISETSSVAFLLTTSCVMIAAASFFAARMRAALSDAERQLQIHAWHLQQLVPSARTGA